MRVVFDSNVLVAALVFPGGTADQAIRRVVGGAHRLLVSKPIIEEVLRVLSRKFSPAAIGRSWPVFGVSVFGVCIWCIWGQSKNSSEIQDLCLCTTVALPLALAPSSMDEHADASTPLSLP